MKKPTKTVPIVLRFKKWKALVQRTAPDNGMRRGPKRPEPHHYGSREEGAPAIRREVDPESIRSAWISAFGRRLKINEQTGFFLDGKPITLDELMIETNRLRKANGIEPVGRNPKWLV